RHTVYRSFKGTKREASAELARLLARVADGGHVDPSKLTVGEHILARLAQWRAAGTISPKTAERYKGLIDYQIIPHLGSRPLQKLGATDVETCHSALLTKGRGDRHGRPDGENGVSARTIRNAHGLLVKALREAVQHDLVLRNVASVQRPPKV